MELDNLSILQAVFESTTDGLLIVSDEGQVIRYNTRFHQLWRIPQEIMETKDDSKLIGHILEQISHPESFLSKVQELYQDPDAISDDLVNFKDGRLFERFSRPLKVNEASVGRVWSFRDITEDKRRQEVFAAITNLSPDIISIVDKNGHLVFISSATKRIHGYEVDELLGSNTLCRIHESDRDLYQEALQKLSLEPGSSMTVQYRYRNKDNSYSWMESTAVSQHHNPQIQGVVSISRLIEKHKQLEEDLGTALRQRDDFMSIASHELKTPITSIKLQLQMLQRAKKSLLPKAQASSRSEDLDGLIDQVHGLQRLIDDLLSVSRIRTGKLSFEPEVENLTSIVVTTVDRFRELFIQASCPLELSLAKDVKVLCDRNRIEQVLINLITNATKYAPNTLVKFELKEENGFAVLSVKDHGAGIPLEKQESIFTLFTRASVSEYVTGLGIGLYISKSIVEGHGGIITVESIPKEGSTFSVRLPLQNK